MKNGFGKMQWADSSSYEGCFFNDLFDNQGTFNYADGTFFKGTWQNGLKNG